MLKPRQITAVRSLLDRDTHDYDITSGEDFINVTTYYAPNSDRHVEHEIGVHKLQSGHWILAEWSELHSQWQSRDISKSFRRANAGTRIVYACARSPEGLAGMVRTYPSAAAAVRSAINPTI